MNYDPDQATPRYLQILEQYLAAPLKRANELILTPKGGSPESIEWNRNRHIRLQAQIEEEFIAVRKALGDWTGKAVSDASRRGWDAGQRQLQAMKWALPSDPSLNASFSGFNMDTARAIALAAFQDADRAMDSTRRRIEKTMRKMADNGLTAADVNALMAGRVIAGKPSALIGDLRQELEAIHGERITFPSGHTMDVGGGNGYARMLARTRLREAAVNGRHQRLITDGVDHVVIIGNVTMYPCTAYIGRIYFIGEGSSERGYPPIDTIDGPPFHPNCSKTTAPIVIELADPAILEAGQPDETTRKMAEAGVNSSAGVTIMKGHFVKQQAAQTQKRIVESIRDQARAAGYEPPPWSPTGSDLRPAVSVSDDPRLLAKMLTDMGVESVHISGRTDIGASAVQAFTQIRTAGHPMPRAITVSQSEFRRDPATVAARHRDGVIYANPNYPGWSNLAKAMKDAADQGLISTNSKNHIFLHEGAHNIMRATRTFMLGDQLIADLVSKRASVNADEFLAEVFAARMSRRKLPSNVMDLYTRLGGK